LKDEKALALIQSTVSDDVFVHIENCIDSWSAWKILKDLFDKKTQAKQVDLQLMLLQQKLVVGGDVMEYISRLKNIKQEISKVGFAKIEDSMMVTILISGFPDTYKNFLETLQLTNKLDNITFDKLCELLLCMTKLLVRNINQVKMFWLRAQVKTPLTKVLLLPKEMNIKQK
jgi:hypothetical protein